MSLVYNVQVFPHHTDYAGVVWHGSYLTWLEEARVFWLAQAGVGYAELVAEGIELPVMELSVKYLRSTKMGDRLLVKGNCTRSGLRLCWTYAVFNGDLLCLTAQTTLVPVDMQKARILRQCPQILETAIAKLICSGNYVSEDANPEFNCNF